MTDDTPGMKAIIERLINEVPAHVSGMGLRIDIDDLRGLLAKAYDEGKRTLAGDPRVKDHDLRLHVDREEEIRGSCTGCEWAHAFGDMVDLEDLFSIFEGHLAQVIDPLGDLPFGTYFDGTYEWEKDDEGWIALNAPQGMPPYPARKGLRRVQKSYVPV